MKTSALIVLATTAALALSGCSTGNAVVGAVAGPSTNSDCEKAINDYLSFGVALTTEGSAADAKKLLDGVISTSSGALKTAVSEMKSKLPDPIPKEYLYSDQFAEDTNDKVWDELEKACPAEYDELKKGFDDLGEQYSGK